MTPHSRLTIRTFEELAREEPAILRRIAEMPNGGNLFMVHPLRLLADIEVELTSELKAQILRRFPELSGLSNAPYDALKSAGGRQNVNFRIHGLFRSKKKISP